jgi:hypothetical protein
MRALAVAVNGRTWLIAGRRQPAIIGASLTWVRGRPVPFDDGKSYLRAQATALQVGPPEIFFRWPLRNLRFGDLLRLEIVDAKRAAPPASRLDTTRRTAPSRLLGSLRRSVRNLDRRIVQLERFQSMPAAPEGGVRFDVDVNGARRVRAGVRGFGVLAAQVSNEDVDQNGWLLEMYGSESTPEPRHLRWKRIALAPGDVVEISVNSWRKTDRPVRVLDLRDEDSLAGRIRRHHSARAQAMKMIAAADMSPIKIAGRKRARRQRR